jgi:hypothetical protein
VSTGLRYGSITGALANVFKPSWSVESQLFGTIHGPALSAGLTIAASCDILVASENASLGLPEINVGLLGGGRHAMRLFGHSKTQRMMSTVQRTEVLSSAVSASSRLVYQRIN